MAAPIVRVIVTAAERRAAELAQRRGKTALKRFKESSKKEKIARAQKIVMAGGVRAVDETGATRVYQRAVADILIERGALVKDDDAKTYRVNSLLALECESVLDTAVCDFCNAQPVTWLAEAEDFTMPHGGLSIGVFATCEPCSRTLFKMDRGALFKRALAYMMADLPKHAESYIKNELAALHNAFWKHFLCMRPSRRKGDQ